MSESKKLVDILAREMSEWPECGQMITQDADGYALSVIPDDVDDLVFDGEEWSGQGGVFCERFNLAVDHSKAIVTRAEWQAARDALLAAEAAKVWSGEGIPGAGQSCNIRFTDRPGSSPHPVTILSFGERKVFYRDALGDEFLHDREYVAYSPIRTPEQIKADERLHKVRNACSDISASIESYNLSLDCSVAMRATVEAMIDAGYAKVDH